MVLYPLKKGHLKKANNMAKTVPVVIVDFGILATCHLNDLNDYLTTLFQSTGETARFFKSLLKEYYESKHGDPLPQFPRTSFFRKIKP